MGVYNHTLPTSDNRRLDRAGGWGFQTPGGLPGYQVRERGSWSPLTSEVGNSYSLSLPLPRGMGGALSPAVGTLQPANQSDPTLAKGWREGPEKEEELELMYDPQLNCFYDPHTCKYYELIS